MQAETYAVEARVEETHWWFVGRRQLFRRELARARISSKGRALDIGTSTGSNLRLLRGLGFTDVTGLDVSPEAIRFCESKGLGSVRLGNVCEIPFADGTFDLVLATDVIEHVKDDRGALAEISRVLAPRGRVLITVPAFESLWGLQDVVAMHERRYRFKPLIECVQRAGLRPLFAYHFNYLLFVPIWMARRIMRMLPLRLESEAQVNTPALNRLLHGIYAFDVWTSPILRPPFGVSILVLAEK